jgi:ribosome-associated translation inhibitor RaiA
MKLSIHAHHLALPKDVSSFLNKHVTRPLARIYDDPAAELAVHFDDSRSQKGGVDQACRLSFRMPGARTVHVESVQDDLYKSLLDAAERLKRHVRKQVDKMRATVRKPIHRPLGRTWRERSSREGVTPEGGPAAL